MRNLHLLVSASWMVLLPFAATNTNAFVFQRNNPSATSFNREWYRLSSERSSPTRISNPFTTLLWGGGASNLPERDDFTTPWERNKARTDIRYLLTQRSIQSFVYLLNQCREEHTVQFLERTLDFTNIDKYHGTGAFNQTLFPRWDSIFLDYVDRPEETIVITVKQRQRRRSSLSGRNTYLENMQPPSAKQQATDKATNPPKTQKPTNRPPRGIAGSYLDSLNAHLPAAKPSESSPLNTQNNRNNSGSSSRITPKGITGNYLESLSSSSDGQGTSNDSSSQRDFATPSDALSQNPFVEEKTIEYELDVDPSAVVRRILAVREQISQEWIQDLDMLMQLNDEILETYEEYKDQQQAAAMEDDDEEDEESLGSVGHGNNEDQLDVLVKKLVAQNSREKAPVFDINVWYTWSQSLFNQDRDSSPFRKKNFDLLLLLSTQESVHRVLKSYKNDDNVRPETYEWLLDFYKDTVRDYFDGHQSFGSAEKFLEKMLRSPPTMIETDTKVLGVLAWVNPAQIAEDIVRERSEVALAWMQVAKSAQDEHTDLRRLLFTNSFTKAEKPGQMIADTIIDPVSMNNPNSIASNSTVGAFE
ncbi:hypothetical protein IV203_013268 [Nitzschia inconspicua]|uniref:Uncharacterized protein n=1 Tax=Nitzschia inconspicua TaxID=303405 RepID=A0A9K3Q7Y0_9STRA|nr:hypothetical protein IV203_013268 [Nitzschia inconspicua]